MVANISERNGRLEAFTALTPAWWDSKKEYVVDHFPHSEEIWGAGGVLHGVEYEKRPIFDERGEIIPSYFRSVRVDTGETVAAGMSSRWQVVQPREAFDWCDSLMQDGIMKYASAGILDGGKKIWILANIPADPNPVDGHRPYCLWADDFTASGALSWFPVVTRVVCENTLNMAMREKGKFRGIRHTGDMNVKLDTARAAILECQESFRQYNADSVKMASASMTADDQTTFVRTLFPAPLDEKGKLKTGASATIHARKIEAVRQGLRFERKNASDTAGSFWGMVQAVSYAVDHGKVLSFKGQDDKRAGNAFKSLMMGTGATIKADAVETALAMIG